jgi:hypothetical protein
VVELLLDAVYALSFDSEVAAAAAAASGQDMTREPALRVIALPDFVSRCGRAYHSAMTRTSDTLRRWALCVLCLLSLPMLLGRGVLLLVPRFSLRYSLCW